MATNITVPDEVAEELRSALDAYSFITDAHEEEVALNDVAWKIKTLLDGDGPEEQGIQVTTGDSWDLLLRGLKDVCIRVNDGQELMVTHFDEIEGRLYGRPWDEQSQEWDGRPEVVIPVDTIRSIHIL